jgi:excinuclease ABC subunit B
VRKREEKRAGESVNLEVLKRSYNVLVPKERTALLKALEDEMISLAKDLEFERAAVVRDEIRRITEGDDT